MDVLDRTPPVADHRIHYGPGEVQFGDLWLPKQPRGPLVVFLHGGWWRAEYGLAYGGHLCAALRDQGLAVWSIEYRRLGNGGGWPGTFQDVAAGYDYVTTLARQYPLDLTRVIAAGHSAGGIWRSGLRDGTIFRMGASWRSRSRGFRFVRWWGWRRRSIFV